ncbi:leucyl aminopeptidase [Orbaceae bacterium ac157xtp]
MIDFKIQNKNIFEQPCDCLILSVWDEQTQSDMVNKFDQLTNNTVKNLIKNKDFNAKLGSTLILFNIPNIVAKKVLLVGVGNKKNFSMENVKTITKSITDKLADINAKNVVTSFTNLTSKNVYEFTRFFVESFHYHLYRFDQYQTDKVPELITKKIAFNIGDKNLHKQALLGLNHGLAIAKGVNATRLLADQPSNVCNAKYLSEQAIMLTKEIPSLSATIYKEKELAKLNMNAYLAVGKGSENESIMTVIEYHGAKNKSDKPIVLVGKGLTFDSGGISIKPSASMDEMKYDMCGAATVFGVMQAVATLELPINIVGVMAGCENMPSGNAYRPGDIITTMSGKTVEVINTDAEGRLVLCDVLTFVERFSPKAVIDIATLTGACIVALGHHFTGVMGNDDKLVKSLVDASSISKDKAWSLPLDNEFKKQIKSTCADIVNSSGRDGGTITAGCFLSEFTENYPWAHLDIAGTAWISSANKGATGRPVSMLVQYLIQQSN